MSADLVAQYGDVRPGCSAALMLLAPIPSVQCMPDTVPDTLDEKGLSCLVGLFVPMPLSQDVNFARLSD